MMCFVSQMNRRRPEPATPAERAARLVMLGLLALAGLACRWPEMATQGWAGLLAGGLGLLMLARVPQSQLPRGSCLAAGVVAVAGAAAFLPASWAGSPAWRGEIVALGQPLGDRITTQPALAAEAFAGTLLMLAAALFTLGHHVGTTDRWRLALVLCAWFGGLLALALWLHQPDKPFGFFPNRNHTATLVAMGLVVAAGTLLQGIRNHSLPGIVVALAGLGVCLFALFGRNESRAGLFLAAAGLALWLAALGREAWRGHGGKALLLLLLAGVGTFLAVDSRVKERWRETWEKVESARAAEQPDSLVAAATGRSEEALALDFRLPVFRDTLQMIRAEPWCGAGPGQFRAVFPHYRVASAVANEADAAHPESDWLMLTAESGAAAAAGLAAGLVLVAVPAWRGLRRGRQRALRAAFLAAALLLPLHGFFDVPGHRAGPLLVALVLAGLALPPRRDEEMQARRVARAGWRVVGALLLAAGVGLFAAHVQGRMFLPSTRVAGALAAIDRHYRADQARIAERTAAGRDPLPAPGEADPLEAALDVAADAIAIAPLDPRLHFARAILALQYDDKEELAAQAFSVQARLIPSRISVPLLQAAAWAEFDAGRAAAALAEAARRAARLDGGSPGRHSARLRHQIADLARRNNAFAKVAAEPGPWAEIP
jgi:O-antigen ligase